MTKPEGKEVQEPLLDGVQVRVGDGQNVVVLESVGKDDSLAQLVSGAELLLDDLKRR